MPRHYLPAILLLAATLCGAASLCAQADGQPSGLPRLPLPPDKPPVSQAISEAEVIGVYADGFAAGWVTEQPTDSSLCIQPDNGEGWCEQHETGQTDHLVQVRGLQPGTHYSYWLLSDGQRAATQETNPGALTTLALPPGEHISDVAIFNDIHIGEGCSGQAFAIGGVSVPPCSVLPAGIAAGDYSRLMFEGAAEQLRKIKPDLVLVNGDLSSDGTWPQMLEVKSLLDGLGLPYEVSRGNHDRANQGGEGEAENCGPRKDCYNRIFRPGSDERVQPRAVELGNIRFLLLDSDNAGQPDLSDPAQQQWLQDQLILQPQKRTFILLHHPVSLYSLATTFPPGNGVLPDKGGQWLRDLVQNNPQVVGVFSGHTHRNILGYDGSGRAPWVENGANKEYPAGFAVLRIYQGGYLREVYRPDCTGGLCRRWASITRRQTFDTARYYALGELRSRAFTYIDDCDHRTPLHESAPWRRGGDSGQDTQDCRGRTDIFP